MPKTFSPRPYQVQAEACAYSDWGGSILRLLISLPTGMGKTVILTNITKREVLQGGRVIAFVNRDELVGQTVATMAAIMPGVSIGVVQGSRREYDAQVIVASIQTLGRDPLNREAVGPVDLIIVDECHHGAAASYVESVRDLGGFTNVRVLGMTATAARTDALGMGDIWQKVTYSQPISYAFRNGYLVEPTIVPVYRRTMTRHRKANLDPAYLARVWQQQAGMRLGMVATDTVGNAEAIHRAFTAAGIPSAVITGSTPASVRKAAYADTLAGRNRVLISVSCLTEGFDMPPLTCVMVARSIGSQVVWAQLVGRVLRLHPGKDDALVLDCSGSSLKFITRSDPYGLTVRPDLSRSKPGKRPERKSAGVTWKGTHTRSFPLFRPITRVYRIEGKSRVRVGTIHWGSEAKREEKARLLIRRLQSSESGVTAAFRS